MLDRWFRYPTKTKLKQVHFSLDASPKLRDAHFMSTLSIGAIDARTSLLEDAAIVVVLSGF